MARRTLTYVAQDGRDKGKTFFLTEMAARQAEDWAVRALLALGRNGTEIPETAFDAGFAGLARVGLGLFMKMDASTATGLLDELMASVEVVPDPKRPNIKRQMIEDDCEEVVTRVKLKVEVFKLHVDFSSADAPLTSGQASAMPARS